MITSTKIEQILSICSACDTVRMEVIKNHDNNLWWPTKVTDGRLRLLIAGLSTRISYNMISTYIRVISNLIQYEYYDIEMMDDSEISSIISPLGLINTRITYLRSMITFNKNYFDSIDDYSNDDLIALISASVKGASYKVAQCCVLYLRGYYCGVMPVDSGMKDVLLPCLGFQEQKASIGHEKLRKELEYLVNDLDLTELVNANGYKGLITIPNDKPLTWWAHLVLIYYKRYFCNKHKPNLCPLCTKFSLPCLCTKKNKDGTYDDNN